MPMLQFEKPLCGMHRTEQLPGHVFDELSPTSAPSLHTQQIPEADCACAGAGATILTTTGIAEALATNPARFKNWRRDILR